MKGIFLQRYTDRNGGGVPEPGTVYFSRSDRMRWEYESPKQELCLVDGTNVWFYVPAGRAASCAELKESCNWRTPLALLTGKTDLSKLCRDIQIIDPVSKRGSATAAQIVRSMLYGVSPLTRLYPYASLRHSCWSLLQHVLFQPGVHRGWIHWLLSEQSRSAGCVP